MAFTDDAFLLATDMSLAAYSNRALLPDAGDSAWTPVTAADLGLPPVGPAANGIYQMTPGVYRQTDGLSGGAAHLYLNEDDGTLALAFRGTDEALDLRDHLDLGTHYARFAPFMAAVADYVEAPASPVESVLVTGHSLGGAMATTAMIDLGWTNNPDVLGITIGGHGTEADIAGLAPNPTTNLVNIIHEDDRLVLSEEPLPTIFTRFGDSLNVPAEAKVRVGVDVFIDEAPNPDVQAGLVLDTALFAVPRGGLGAHSLNEYTQDIEVLHAAGVLDPTVLGTRAEWNFTIDPRTGDVIDDTQPLLPRFLELMRTGREDLIQDIDQQFETLRADTEQTFAQFRANAQDALDLFG